MPEFIIEMISTDGKCTCWLAQKGTATSIPHWTYTREQALAMDREDTQNQMQLIYDHYPQWNRAVWHWI